MTRKPILIVGGGLAGLTLGIALRREGVEVTLLEAGHYPRHRVCGEFLSGRGPSILKELGLEKKLAEAGSREATTARFFLRDRDLGERLLPTAATCLPRYALAALLAREFTELGGELRQNTRWRCEPGAVSAGVVLASGRRLQAVENGCRWVGLKVHVHGVNLLSDLEMHAFENGYIGLCRVGENLANLCGLFRLPEKREPAFDGRELLFGPPGSALRERLKVARTNAESFCSVAGLGLAPAPFENPAEVRIGDALTMIPPVTGNGMSMALESAELAGEPLLNYARGSADWGEVCREIASGCRQRFARRLRWAGFLHRALFSRAMEYRVAVPALRNVVVWRILFQLTR